MSRNVKITLVGQLSRDSPFSRMGKVSGTKYTRGEFTSCREQVRGADGGAAQVHSLIVEFTIFYLTFGTGGLATDQSGPYYLIANYELDAA